MIFSAPALIIPPEKPAIVRASDLKGMPSWQEVQRREKALREGYFPFPCFIPNSKTISLAFQEAKNDTSNTTTYSFAGSQVGSQTIRKIVVTAAVGVGGSDAISGATVAGNAMTAAATQQGGSNERQAIFYYDDTTGAIASTATIVITVAGGGGTACEIGIWSMTGAAAGAPAFTATDNTGQADLTINCAAGGCIIAAGMSRMTTVGTYTWTNLDEKFDADIEAAAGQPATGASRSFSSAQTSLAVVCAPDGTLSRGIYGVAAAFSPA